MTVNEGAQRDTETHSDMPFCITAVLRFHSNNSNMPPRNTLMDRKIHTTRILTLIHAVRYMQRVPSPNNTQFTFI